jgi:hypothetical protein
MTTIKTFLVRTLVGFGILMCLFLLYTGWRMLPPLWAVSKYRPQVGDVLVQDIDPCGRLLRAVKGVSQSGWCHCGVVDSVDGRWVVHEAVGSGVQTTPIVHFLLRGDDPRFAVYRLTDQFRHQAEMFAQNCLQYLGRPYDSKYEMDDEKIYCSELVYKAYLSATGEPLVPTQRLGDLNWTGHVEEIKHYSESDDLPAVLTREVVTPVALTYSSRLQKVLEVK